MKKLLIVAALLLLAGLGYWKVTSRPAGQNPATDGKSETAMEEFTGSLMAAMQKNVPMQCSWQSGENSGESFIQGNNIYVATTMNGKMGYMIKKDNCFWTWGDSQPQGVKFCSDPETVSGDQPESWAPAAGSYQAEGVDWQVEYKCRPAMFGADKFNPPGSVQFLDTASMMKGLGLPAETE